MESRPISHRLDAILNKNPNITVALGEGLNLHQILANRSVEDDQNITSKLVFTKSTPELVIIIAVYLPVVVFSLLINIFVCYILLKKSRKFKSTHYFIINLSLSDIALTLFNIPFNIIRNTTESWIFGGFLCGSGHLILNASVYASTLTMTAIALERYRIILCPLRPRLSSGVTAVILCCIWIMSFLFSMPFVVYSEVRPVVFLRGNSVTLRCGLNYPHHLNDRYIIIGNFILQFALPLLLTGAVYSYIISKLWSQQSMTGQSFELHRITHWRSRKRSICMLVVVLALFSVCWLPLNIYHMVIRWQSDTFKANSKVYMTFHWIAMTSICYNPLVYCWTRTFFRAEFRKRMLCVFNSPRFEGLLGSSGRK